MAQGQGRDEGQGRREQRASRDDLKAREYRDEKGQIHHHTRTFMEQQEGSERPKTTDEGGRAADRSAADRSSGRSAHTSTDHAEIRSWAERRGGKPAAVARTHKGGDVGIVRIMFPDAPRSEHDALVEISWDEFFKEFELRKLALLYDPDSMFSKMIGRDTAEKRAQGDHKAAR